MRHSRMRWVRGIGAVALAGGLWMVGAGTGVTPAWADGPPLVLPGVTQNWDKNLPSTSRFTVLAKFNNLAVRDNNTGLVWEQAPDIIGGPNADGRRTWLEATSYCANKKVAGTVGWRLPSVVELKSVQDPTLPPPYVPTSVFTGVQSNSYHSASTYAGNPDWAWGVAFNVVAGEFDGLVGANGKTAPIYVWCVRGGTNADAY